MRLTGSLIIAGCCLALLAATPRQADRPPLYDPLADPYEDLRNTIVEAQEAGKNILLNIGGDWCGWCYILDQYINDNDDVRELFEANFVVLKVNMSPENRNEEFLAQYPRVIAYPYFFVLAADGSFLHAQRTGPLEEGRSYDKAKMMGFLREWGPK